MSELIFNRVDHEKYNTFSLYIDEGDLELEKNDFVIIKVEKTKYDYNKAIIKINKEEVQDEIKEWERQINDYLKSVGVGPLTILYGNRIYTKTSLTKATKKKENNLNFKKIWVNDKNKPFMQIWYESS